MRSLSARISKYATTSFLFLGLLIVPLQGQTSTGTILGTVTDESGAVVPGVAVTVRQTETGALRTTLTDDSGSYEIPLLGPGQYEITAELAGFNKEVISGITLRVKQTAVIDVVLRVGEMTEEVQVLGRTQLVESKDASVGAVIEEQRIVELPLNGREVLQLNLLTPGVTPAVKGSQLGEQGGAIYANGMREHSNTFLLDGINQTDRAIGQFAISPVIDTVQEFRVETTSYSAEHGRSAGAHMNVVTKSGSNEFHGSIYAFHRNDALDARNFFAVDDRDGDGKADADPLKRWQFGGTVGGPIVRDRTFFFFSYEGTQLSNSTTRQGRVPEPAWINGDFSDLLPDTQIVDPLTGQPFPGNVIPSSRMSPIGSTLAKLYPPPNLTGVRNYGVSAPNALDTSRYMVRADHKISESNTLSGRYNIDDFDKFFGINLFAFRTIIPGFGRRDESRFQSLGFNDVHVFNESTLNEARVGYTRWALNYQSEDPSNRVQELGIQGLTGLDRNTGWPAINVVGFEALGDATNVPQAGPGNTYQISEALYLRRGNHSIKAGTDIWFYSFGNFYIDVISRGLFIFSGQFSGHAVADLLLGNPFLSLRGLGNTDLTFSQQSYDFYVQDDWKVTPNLTLNLGLRYEYNTPYVEKEDRFTNFYLDCGCLVLAGQDATRSTYDNDPNNFAPRVGFAWDPTGENKMALRGGYGVFYDSTILNTILALRLSPPHYEINLFLSDPAVPNLTLEDPFPSTSALPSIPSPGFFARDFRDGYVQQWSLNYQWEFLPDTLLDIGYLGTKGTHLYSRVNHNQALPGGSPIQDRRSFPQFGDSSGVESAGFSSYHSLQLKVDKRFSRDFSVLGSYTFSKSLDSNSAYGGNSNNDAFPQNSHNKLAEKGLSSFDIRNRLALSYIWALPFGPGKRFGADTEGFWGQFLRGWQVTGITTFQSGSPSNPVLGVDNANTGTSSQAQRPDRVGDPELNNPTPEQFINTSAFQAPPPFSFGNSGRNVIIGPGLVNFDFSIVKNTYLRENDYLQFRFEFFNAFNRPNFDNPNRNFNSALFGQLFSAGAARELQVALKYVF